MRYAPNESPICGECLASSIVNSTQMLKKCPKCANSFCAHYRSEIDPKFCGNCMVEVGKEVEVYKKRDLSSKIKLTGSDFFFAERMIHEMSDDQIEINIEYYDAMKGLLRNEQVERKIERQARLSRVKLNIVGPAPTATPSPKKAKTKAQPNIAAILTALWGRVPTQQEIDAFTAAASGGTK